MPLRGAVVFNELTRHAVSESSKLESLSSRARRVRKPLKISTGLADPATVRRSGIEMPLIAYQVFAFFSLALGTSALSAVSVHAENRALAPRTALSSCLSKLLPGLLGNFNQRKSIALVEWKDRLGNFRTKPGQESVLDPDRNAFFDSNPQRILEALSQDQPVELIGDSGSGKTTSLGMVQHLWESAKKGLSVYISAVDERTGLKESGRIIEELLSKARRRATELEMPGLVRRLSGASLEIQSLRPDENFEAALDFIFGTWTTEAPDHPILLIVDEANHHELDGRAIPIVRWRPKGAANVRRVYAVTKVPDDVSVRIDVRKSKVEIGPKKTILIQLETHASVRTYLDQLTSGTIAHFDDHAVEALMEFTNGKQEVIRRILMRLPKHLSLYGREEIWAAARKEYLVVPLTPGGKVRLDWWEKGMDVRSASNEVEWRSLQMISDSLRSSSVIVSDSEFARSIAGFVRRQWPDAKLIMEEHGRIWVPFIHGVFTALLQAGLEKKTISEWRSKIRIPSLNGRTEELTAFYKEAVELLKHVPREKYLLFLEDPSDPKDAAVLARVLDEENIHYLWTGERPKNDNSPAFRMTWPTEAIQAQGRIPFSKEGLEHYLRQIPEIEDGRVQFSGDAKATLLSVAQDWEKLVNVLRFLPPEAREITPVLIRDAVRRADLFPED